jgi:hypothetical protein
MVAALVQNISLTDVLLLCGIIGIVIDRIADTRGWSRSSKRLREENTDLLRIREEDKQTIIRHEHQIVKSQTEIISLKAQIDILKERDQLAVLEALKDHETHAESRAITTQEILIEIRDVLTPS